MKEHLDYYSPTQYLRAVELFKQGKMNKDVSEELYLSRKAVLNIKKLIKSSLSVEQIKQLK